MIYSKFESVISSQRMQKYLDACNGNTKMAMSLYRLNLHLSQEIFTIISCFEIALRNAIDYEMTLLWGNDWLRDLTLPGGEFFKEKRIEQSRKIINKAYEGLVRKGTYTHFKLIAELEFGVWKYMFSNIEYRLSGRILLKIFPNKPRSSSNLNIDNTYIFNELDYVNNIRNRIAHHEPIVFSINGDIDTFYALSRYDKIIKLFYWMNIDSKSLLYGLDHINQVCTDINRLKNRMVK